MKNLSDGVIDAKIYECADRFNLNLTDAMILSQIRYFTINDLDCFCKDDFFCKKALCSAKTVQRSLSKLESLGLIHIENHQSKYRRFSYIGDEGLLYSDNLSSTETICPSTKTKCPSTYIYNIYTNKFKDNKSIVKKKNKNKGKGNAIDNTKQASNNKRSNTEEDSDLDHQLSTAMQKYLESADTIMGTPTDVVYDKLIYLATTFEERYKERFGNPHPSLRADDLFSPMGECISNLFTGKKTIADVTKPDLDAMIDKYFETKYREGCDYHFPHFCRTEIWVNRLHEVERESGRGGFYGISTAEKNEVKDVIDVIDRWYEDYSSEQMDETYGERDTLIHAEYCP